MLLSQGVQAKIENYVDIVKKVSLELRALLNSVNQLVPHFPSSNHREVQMAELVSALKLAERNSNTTLDNEYRKGNAVCSPHFGYERQKSFRHGRSYTHQTSPRQRIF
ncbi:hypothetical protein DAPPUDRAFT_309576 [Daphnia pulex]|uniref:Focal AT domain-containing protein n=1 Tax=Daphnia pulex TaxID=6669 RepID=E9FRW8_DAPPU|nr:hypothetical protein DAPPUDRAFT_309576 [Daphnia pulex]|eukprot:EFX89920.1 hypothetical protein DAPPUDRAFT_309576 [Daphnia pulex]